jgi:hypothetical protein
MIIHDLNVMSSGLPAKADPPLIVDADRVLAIPATY